MLSLGALEAQKGLLQGLSRVEYPSARLGVAAFRGLEVKQGTFDHPLRLLRLFWHGLQEAQHVVLRLGPFVRKRRDEFLEGSGRRFGVVTLFHFGKPLKRE